VKRLSLFFVAILLLVTACAPAARAGGAELTIPSKWKLESFGKAGSEAALVQGSTVTLEFNADGQLSGNGGCNGYGGKYEIQGSSIKITEVVSTLMACADDAVTQQESQYFKALQSASGFEVSGDTLTILYDNGQSKLIFGKQ
jgi:putative lipoprotein